jgi:ABC-type branched-subunit amino acid transport system substrate-binding protein
VRALKSTQEVLSVHRRVGLAVTLVAVIGLIAAAAAFARPSAGTIDIGWLGDKTGPTASSQLPSLHGLETAIKYVNSQGGVGGKQINLIEKDDQYNPTTELSLLKSLISDSHVPVVMGLGQSTGYASAVPLLDQNKVIGQSMQSVLKLTSSPFNPWLMSGTCSYADQVDIGIAYEMKHLGLKSLKGVPVGVAAIQVASGQEVIDETTRLVQKLGGTVVVENLPAALISADVQVQDLQSKGVKFVIVHHAIAGAITFLRAMDKFNLNIPIVGMSGITEAPVFTTAPYSQIKNMVGMNCFDPTYLAKTAAAKKVGALGTKYGIASATDLTEANFVGGWTNGMLLVQALKNAKGNYTSDAIRKGYEAIKNFDPAGGMTPLLSYGPKCHIAWPNPRPYTFNFKKQQFAPVGSWAQWNSADTKPYAPVGTCGVK